jgi:hypothetical protein
MELNYLGRFLFWTVLFLILGAAVYASLRALGVIG